MGRAPSHIQALLEEREAARAAKDFARADALRDQVGAAGFSIRDTPEGPVAEPVATFAVVDPHAVASELGEAPTLVFSLHVLYEGHRDDLERFLSAFERTCALPVGWEVVVVDNASGDGEWLADLPSRFAGVRTLHLAAEVGWAAARNAGLRTSRGEIIVLLDLSIEPTGDILSPLREALSDPTVGVAGPFGLTTASMREFEPSEGPEVDAVEGYLLAARREVLAKELINERFKWYRNADIDLCFQIRNYGLSARAVPLPVVKHEHRGWEALEPEERAKRSKRNHYIFFDRWKHHPELLISHRHETEATER